MVKGGVFILGIAFVLGVFLLSGFVSGLIISEVELNPKGDDRWNEWVEIYSDEQVDLSNYYLMNGDGDTWGLWGNVSGYFALNFSVQWLDNENESVYLRDNLNTSTYSTPVLKDGRNDNRTWNNCGVGWVFIEGSRGYENYCPFWNPTNVNDLLGLLASWGSCSGGECIYDYNLDGVVDGFDLDILLALWGGEQDDLPESEIPQSELLDEVQPAGSEAIEVSVTKINEISVKINSENPQIDSYDKQSVGATPGVQDMRVVKQLGCFEN